MEWKAVEISQKVAKEEKKKKRGKNRNQFRRPNIQVIEAPEKDNREKRKGKKIIS